MNDAVANGSKVTLAKPYVVYKTGPVEYVRLVSKAQKVRSFTLNAEFAKRFTLSQARSLCQSNNASGDPSLTFSLAPEYV